MSRTYSSTQDQNQKQKNSKVTYHSYFNNSNGPWMYLPTDLRVELEAEIAEIDGHLMQKIMRRTRRARRMKLSNA